MEIEQLSPKDESNSIKLIRTEKPNSYEFGKAGNRFKIYFDTPEDLQVEILKLKNLGIYKEDNNGSEIVA